MLSLEAFFSPRAFLVQFIRVSRAKTMSGTVNLRIAKIIVLILSVFDIILAIGFFIKASVNKNIDYKYIHNETEWNVLYISLIACAILMLYGIFRNEHLFVIAGLVLKVLTALILIYAVIRGKLENLRCERELCRFTETSYCAACYSGTRKNKFEYEYTPRWTCKFS